MTVEALGLRSLGNQLGLGLFLSLQSVELLELTPSLELGSTDLVRALIDTVLVDFDLLAWLLLEDQTAILLNGPAAADVDALPVHEPGLLRLHILLRQHVSHQVDGGPLVGAGFVLGLDELGDHIVVAGFEDGAMALMVLQVGQGAVHARGQLDVLQGLI